jgi:hypothetical protein
LQPDRSWQLRAKQRKGKVMSNNIFQMSHQWATRPDDERFTSLTALHAAKLAQYHRSTEKVVGSRDINAQGKDDDPKALQIVGPKGNPINVTHWSFGQLCKLADSAPADWLRKLPGVMAADQINFGLHVLRKVEDTKLLLRNTENGPELAAATGARYGRVWDCDATHALAETFGDGQTGRFRMPGTFGTQLKPEDYTKENSSIFSSDRDTFVFLTDDSNRMDIKNRRNGQTGQGSRGVFFWNSETGSKSIGAAFFFYDYMCCNRIIWNVSEFKEIRLRHSAGAPKKWLDEIKPVLREYANSAIGPVEAMLQAAQKQKVENVQRFLTERYNKARAAQFIAAHEREEGRPIETVWDIATAISAHAKTLAYTDSRVELEREAGKVLELVAA